jgi:hypothetical protein
LQSQTKTVLITVKTYPNPSQKYGETVCCAGIDIDSNNWVRLYPIPYRDLDESQKFKKYNIIKVKCTKSADKRVESYKVDSDSIEVLDHLDTKKDKWLRRKDIVLPTISSSFCQITKGVSENKSLGTFKPCDITFDWSKVSLGNSRKREACYAQLSFFDKNKEAIEKIPFDFYYHFKCHNKPGCPGHKLLIIDWELGQSYRSWRYRYKEENVLLEKIKERWLDRICAEKNDIYFYVGNMRRFTDQFMVLGVFYPPK